MVRRVGMYPAFSFQDKWQREGNPLLKFLTEAINRRGWEVVPIELDELLMPARLVEKNLAVLHLHWPDAIAHSLVVLKPFHFFAGPPVMNRFLQRLEIGLKTRRSFPASWFAGEPNRVIQDWLVSLQSTKIPLVWEVHDLVTHSAVSGNAFWAASEALFRGIYALAQSLILHENSCWEPVFQFYGTKKPFGVAPLGDYALVHGPARPQAESRSSLGIPTDGRVLAYIGTARKNRNPARISRWFTKLAGPNDTLLIAGQGTARYVRTVRDSRFRVFNGLVPTEKIRDIACAADFVINDAPRYLTSAVIRMAMSYGRPVIAYSYGSTLDMARGAAVFIDEGDNGLASAITKALRMDNSNYRQLAEAALQRNAERSWDQAGAGCVDTYNRILAEE